MKDFSTLDNTSGAFPDVLATNSSGPTLRDGTPVNANLVNDIWGAFQAILNTAGTTPSGSVDSSSASDLLDSIRKVAGAPGELVFHGAPDDSSLDANVLPLKGQVVTIASYPDLVAATYIGDANNSNTAFTGGLYKTSDAAGTTRDTAGPYFVLPDCRGYFLRALSGSATGRDVGRDAIGVSTGFDYNNMAGWLESESPGSHKHDVVESADANGLDQEQYWLFTSYPGSVDGGFATVTPESRFLYKEGTTSYDLETAIGKNGVTGSTYDSDFTKEVRPANVAFQLGIRY